MPALSILSLCCCCSSALQNPYEAEVGGIRVLGHSGQPLDDIARYAGASDVMERGTADGSGNDVSASAEVDDIDMTTGASSSRSSSSAAAAEGVGSAASSGSATFDETVATGAGVGADARAHAGPDGHGIVASLNPLDILHNCLLWRHMAPTAPDTLGCYPFYEGERTK